MTHVFYRRAFARRITPADPAAHVRSSLPGLAVQEVRREIASEMSQQNIPPISTPIATDLQVRRPDRYGHSIKESLMRNRVLSNITFILVLSTVANPGAAVAQQSSFFAQDLTLHQTTTSSGRGGKGDNKSAEATTYFSRDAMRAS